MRKLIALLLLIPSIAFAQTQHDRIDARGQVKTDKFINRAIIVITGTTPDVSTGNVFKTNNGGAVTISNFLNGVDTQQIKIICGEGNTVIANNANIVTASGSNFTCALNQSIEFTYDAVQVKWVQSGSVSGGGGGGSPGAPTNAVQKNSGSGTFIASGETSDGTTFSVNEDAKFKGPNPNFDLRQYGGYSSGTTPPSTTGSITSGLTTLTLGSAQDFANGQGIVVYKAGASPVITTPGQPTVTPINLGGGATTYSYKAVAEDRNGGLTAAGSTGSTTTGRASLGANTVSITSCVRVSGVATYTTSSTHNIAVGTQVNIGGFSTFSICNGVKTVATVPTGTTFTTNDGNVALDENVSASATVTVYACNKLDFPSGSYSGPTTLRYWIYRNSALVGVAQGTDPFWIDCGLTAPIAPAYIPSSPPGSTQPGYLATTITAGGGTTTLTLANAAGTTASSQTVLHDNSAALLACLTAVLTNQTGGTCFVPNPSGFNKWVFNATTDISSLSGVNPSRIHLAGDVYLNQPWLLRNVLEIQGEARQTASFMYVPGSDIGGNAYPLLMAQYPFATNSIHLKALRVSANQSQQTALLTDQGPNTGGFVGLISDDVAYISQNGNGNPVVIKSGFDYYFNRGTISSGGTSFSPTVALINTIASPAVVGAQSVLIAGRINLDKVYFANNGIVFDCSPYATQNFFGTNWRFSNILYESQRAPLFRMNCPGAGNSQLSDFKFETITIADSGVGFGTPVVDSQTTLGMYATFQGGNGISAATPTMVGGGGVLAIGGIPAVSSSSLSVTIGGAFGTNGVNFGVAGNGRFFSALTPPPAPTSLVVSAGGAVPIGAGKYELTCVDTDGNQTLVGPAASVTTSSGNQTVTGTPPTLPIGCVGYFVYRQFGGGFSKAQAGPLGCAAIAPNVSFVDNLSFTCGNSIPSFSVAASSALTSGSMNTPSIKLFDQNNSGFLTTTAFPSALTANRTLKIPDLTGTLAFKDAAQTWSATQTNMTLATPTVTGGTQTSTTLVTPVIGGETISSAPHFSPPIFLPGALTSTWTGASWILDKAITVTRLQTAAKYVPSGCGTNAVIRLTDGSTPVNLTLTAATNDSGVISQNYAAGATLTVSISTAASGCTVSPGDVNVLTQYKMQ